MTGKGGLKRLKIICDVINGRPLLVFKFMWSITKIWRSFQPDVNKIINVMAFDICKSMDIVTHFIENKQSYVYSPGSSGCSSPKIGARPLSLTFAFLFYKSRILCFKSSSPHKVDINMIKHSVTHL